MLTKPLHFPPPAGHQHQRQGDLVLCSQTPIFSIQHSPLFPRRLKFLPATSSWGQ